MYYAKVTTRIADGKNGAVTVHAFDLKAQRDLFVERLRHRRDKISNTVVDRESLSTAEAELLVKKHGRSSLIKHSFIKGGV